MEVVDVNVHSLRRVPSHESEPLRSQAISPRSIRAGLPLDAFKVDPAVVRERVQATTKWHAARSGSPLGMIVSLVDGGMVVEVFLEVDEVVAVLGEVAADLPGIIGLVARNLIALQDLRETGYVEAESSEFSVRRRTENDVRRKCDRQEYVLHIRVVLLVRRLIS